MSGTPLEASLLAKSCRMSCQRNASIFACPNKAFHAVFKPVNGKGRSPVVCFFQRSRTFIASVLSGIWRVCIVFDPTPSMVRILLVISIELHLSPRSSPRRMPVLRLKIIAGSRWSAKSSKLGNCFFCLDLRHLFADSRCIRILWSRVLSAVRRRPASSMLRYRTFGERSNFGTSTFLMMFDASLSSFTARLKTPEIVARSRAIVDGLRPWLMRSSFHVSKLLTVKCSRGVAFHFAKRVSKRWRLCTALRGRLANSHGLYVDSIKAPSVILSVPSMP